MSLPAPAQWFSADGPLAAHIPGYSPRPVQQDMAEAVAAALESGEHLLVEAPTGTGKTLAYLLPALASGHKVIISTATRHLQDQLYSKDVPLVRAALGRPLKVSLLKGRSNYLCLHRLSLTETAGDLRRADLLTRLRNIRQWAGRTRSGDIGEIGDPADGSPLWPRVTSTADNCLGTSCPVYDKCWVIEARRKAQAADLVIVNHYLLFADMSLREEGFGEVLPGADAVILDEAHKLPDIAGRFFGQAMSGRQLRDLVRDGHAEAEEAGGDMPDLNAAIDGVATAEISFEQVLGEPRGSAAWAELANDSACQAAMQMLTESLNALKLQIEPVAERTEGLGNIARRSNAACERLALLQTEDNENVRWLERRGAGWILHATPLDVAAPFGRALAVHNGAWVFTSATLSVNQRLEFFADRLGLHEATRLILESPFDYERNSLLYTPEGLPDIRSPDFDESVAEAALPLIRSSGGGAFLLCTSYRAVNRCAQRLRAQGVSPLLVQGEAGRAELLQRFRAVDNAVLVGTSSFWEGVDVRGRGLRLVIIDRLPFASPGDPVLRARIQFMKAQGEEPFTSYQLPHAVIALKQGVGRLIRDKDDRGLLAICDPRLRNRGYGKVFLESLPSMPQTRDLQVARDFLAAMAEPASI